MLKVAVLKWKLKAKPLLFSSNRSQNIVNGFFYICCCYGLGENWDDMARFQTYKKMFQYTGRYVKCYPETEGVTPLLFELSAINGGVSTEKEIWWIDCDMMKIVDVSREEKL